MQKPKMDVSATNTRSFYIINKHVQMCTSQTSLSLCFYTPLSLSDYVWSPTLRNNEGSWAPCCQKHEKYESQCN